jgi:hypothetical protein
MADCGGRGAGAGQRMAEVGRKVAQTMLMGGLNGVHVCQKKIHIFFYATDIPHSTRTIRGTNLIQWCQ